MGNSSSRRSLGSNHTATLVTPPRLNKKLALAPHTPDCNSDLECPICFLNFTALNIASCCKQQICTGCYNQFKPKSSNSKITCPFCNNEHMIVSFDSSSQVVPANNIATNNNSQSSSLKSTEKNRKPEKEVYVPYATSEDRQKIEESILNSQQKYQSDIIPPSSYMQQGQMNRGGRRLISSLNRSQPINSSDPFDAFERLHQLRRRAQETNQAIRRSQLQRNDEDDIDGLRDLESTTDLRPGGDNIIDELVPIISRQRINPHTNIRDIRTVNSLEDLEELMLQEAMRLSMEVSQTQHEQSGASITNTSIETTTTIHNNNNSDKSESPLLPCPPPPNHNPHSALKANHSPNNAGITNDIDQHHLSMEMSDEEQLSYALQLSLHSTPPPPIPPPPSAIAYTHSHDSNSKIKASPSSSSSKELQHNENIDLINPFDSTPSDTDTINNLETPQKYCNNNMYNNNKPEKNIGNEEFNFNSSNSHSMAYRNSDIGFEVDKEFLAASGRTLLHSSNVHVETDSDADVETETEIETGAVSKIPFARSYSSPQIKLLERIDIALNSPRGEFINTFDSDDFEAERIITIGKEEHKKEVVEEEEGEVNTSSESLEK